MRQFPPETNRYITSAREREKKEKKLFSLFLEKHKFFFLEWCASCSTALGTLIWGICVNKQAKLLQRWCSLVKRGQLTRMQEFSGCCSNTVGCLLLLIFWRNLLSTPPTSLPLSPPRPPFFESAVGRSCEEISVFWLSWARRKKQRGESLPLMKMARGAVVRGMTRGEPANSE